MKKKIRELTDEEMDKICDKNYKKYKTCYDCPLKAGMDSNNCLKYLGLDLDQEVEVEEDE